MSTNRITHPTIATRTTDSSSHGVKYVLTAIIVLLAIAAIALTASCAKQGPDRLPSDAIQGYTVHSTTAWTKATPTNTFPHTSFGLFASAYSGAWDGTATPNYIYNLPVTETTDTWTTASTYFWPGALHMRFFAYAPYQSSTAAEGITALTGSTTTGAPILTYTLPTTLSAQRDLMVASTADLSTLPGTGLIPLTFSHALSMISLTARTTNPGSTYDITGVTLGVTTHPSRNLSLDDCTWLPPTPEQAATLQEYALPDITVTNSYQTLTTPDWIAAIPKSDNSASVTLTLTFDGRVYGTTIENFPLQKGTTYHIAGDINPTSVFITITATTAGQFHTLGSFTIRGSDAGSFYHNEVFTLDSSYSGNLFNPDDIDITTTTPGSFTRITPD